MEQKRSHTRVSLSARATLIDKENHLISASIADLSLDGITVTGISHLLEYSDYQVELITDDDSYVARFGARLIHQNDYRAGFQITVADGVSLKNIIHICYQNTR